MGEGRRTEKKRKGGSGGGEGKKLGEGEERNLPFAEGGITWLRGCQSKRFCFILFLQPRRSGWVGLARGEGGWADGAGLSAWRDLFMPLDPRADDCDAGLLKNTIEGPPSPLSPAFLLGTLGVHEKPSDFSRAVTPPSRTPRRRGGGRSCAPARCCERPRTRVGTLITTTKRTSQPGSNAASSTENIRRPATSRAARGRGRRPRPGFISRESSSVRTRCQHSRTVYGIRIPQGGSSAVRVLAAMICPLSCRGVP